MEYKFHGWDSSDVTPIDAEYAQIKNQRHLYDLMCNVWSVESCAPRYRCEWSEENITRGQCSITSFLVQDIFGGKVYGVPLSEGGFHCYNVVGDSLFDLTSEQFQGKENLVFAKENEQFREVHFASEEKKARYELLKEGLKKELSKMNKALHTDSAPAAIGPYSQAIKAGDTVYVSGQLGLNPAKGDFDADDIKVQTKQSLSNIKAILATEGYTMNDIVKTTVLLKDIGEFAAMNEVYAEFFEAPFPARAAFQVAALPKDGRVEIEAVAVKK